MFGTDLPVCQAKEACGLTERYRQHVAAWKRMGLGGDAAFRAFLGGAWDAHFARIQLSKIDFACAVVAGRD